MSRMTQGDAARELAWWKNPGSYVIALSGLLVAVDLIGLWAGRSLITRRDWDYYVAVIGYGEIAYLVAGYAVLALTGWLIYRFVNRLEPGKRKHGGAMLALGVGLLVYGIALMLGLFAYNDMIRPDTLGERSSIWLPAMTVSLSTLGLVLAIAGFARRMLYAAESPRRSLTDA